MPWCDRASQADGACCCCSCGGGKSPVQAALISAGWETSRGSSPRMKSRKKKFCPFVFTAVVFPLLWVWESGLCVLLVVCVSPVVTFGHWVVLRGHKTSHRHSPLPGMAVSIQEVQPLNHKVLSSYTFKWHSVTLALSQKYSILHYTA